MKHPLFFKLLVLLLTYIGVGLLAILTLTGNFLKNTIIKTESADLYKTAASIAGSYAEDYYNDEETLADLYTEITTLGVYLDSVVRVISTSGAVIADSSRDIGELEAEPLIIEDFNPSDYDYVYSQLGDFYGSFDEHMVNVIAPITIDYKTRGYISIHKPVSIVTAEVDTYINSIYKTFGIIVLIALLVFLYAIIFHYLPLARIAKIAKSYGNGVFDTPIAINRKDELGTISDTMDAMAYALDTLEKDQRKFLSNISHDLRSPLTSIRGYANAIADGTIPTEEQKKYLEIIVYETMRLTKLTENLLALNTIGEKGLPIIYDTFDLNKVIRQTLAIFEGRCIEKNIIIDLILTGNEMSVSADEGKIRQVLSNLIDNAIKFSPEDSSIKIETTERNSKIYVSIKDNGIGIPKESIRKIWDRFYKTDESRGQDKTGSGLGLSIVKEIIQAHDENINVISTVGVGTEFIFTLKKV